jgi:putative NADPH-quinone reductase
MKISIILAHPDPASLNHAIARTAKAGLRANGHDVILHDLYAERFDPILNSSEISETGPVPPEIERYGTEISSADGIVIVHPNWWGQPPAILKGWIDRVLRPGVAYRFLEGDTGEGIPTGLLKAKAAVIFNTANTPSERERNVFGDPLQQIWGNCIFELCGVKEFHREIFTVVVTSSHEQRQIWLDHVREIMDQYFPRRP